MTKRKKDVLIFILAALLAVALFFMFPGLSNSAKHICPPVPTGALSPSIPLLSDDWRRGVAPLGDQYILMLMQNKNQSAPIAYAMAIFMAPNDWPVLFNYVENGVIYFLRIDIKTQSYVWDDGVDEATYNLVVKMYWQFLRVEIKPIKRA
jgi:hypothetical protein